MKARDKYLIQGICIACASLCRDGMDCYAEEILGAAGINDRNEMVKADVDEYDLDAIAKAMGWY